MNIKMLRPADFNEKLREHGIDKSTTVQKICRAGRDEKEIREVLEKVWLEPSGSENNLKSVLAINNPIFTSKRILRAFALVAL